MTSLTLFSLSSVGLRTSSKTDINQGVVLYRVKDQSKIIDKMSGILGSLSKLLDNDKSKMLVDFFSGNQVTDYKLRFGKGLSEFRILNQGEKDPLSFNTVRAEITGDYFQNTIQDQIIQVRTIYGKEYTIEFSISDLRWDILEEYETIGESKVRCRKAICHSIGAETLKFPIEVWFAEGIELPFGPAGFGGLPGLIIELKLDELTTFMASKIQFNDEMVDIIIPESTESVDRGELKAILKKAIKQRRKLRS